MLWHVASIWIYIFCVSITLSDVRPSFLISCAHKMCIFCFCLRLKRPCDDATTETKQINLSVCAFSSNDRVRLWKWALRSWQKVYNNKMYPKLFLHRTNSRISCTQLELSNSIFAFGLSTNGIYCITDDNDPIHIQWPENSLSHNIHLFFFFFFFHRRRWQPPTPSKILILQSGEKKNFLSVYFFHLTYSSVYSSHFIFFARLCLSRTLCSFTMVEPHSLLTSYLLRGFANVQRKTRLVRKKK